MTIEQVFERISSDHPMMCWPWQGARTTHGYGVARVDGRLAYVHRLVYEHFSGRTLEAKEIVMHVCDNPSCANPAHLRSGSQSDNMKDCSQKGRLNHPSSAKTHCKRGHEFTAENTFYSSGRQCRECRRYRDRLYAKGERVFA